MDQGKLDLPQEVSEAELLDPWPLDLGESGDEARFLRRVKPRLSLPVRVEGELAVVLVLSRRHAGGDADAGVGGELGQLVGAPLRLEQVGGEHRVVSKGQRGALARRGREQAVAAAAERLGVVGNHAAPGQRQRQLVQRRCSGDDPLAIGTGPVLAGDRQRQRLLAGAQVGGGALHRLDLELGLDLAPRDDLALRQGFLEALEHGSQLELAHEVAQGATVGLGAHHLAQLDPGLDVVLQRCQLLRHAGVVGVLDQVLLALGPGDLIDGSQHRLEVAELLQQLGRGLLADPGNARDVVRSVAAAAPSGR